ncbi:MAG: redoxin domain-containing protein [Bryobacterales bacterium]|nr:redoxin domain-containing protein [Bryobacterales bacterium]
MTSVVLAVLLFLSLSLNVWHALVLNDIRSRSAASSPLAVGTHLEPLVASDLDGRQVVVDFAATEVPTVLYVFSPQCVWCERNVENIRELAAQVKGRYRFVALSTSSQSIAEYVRVRQFDFDVLINPSASVVKTYRLGPTPQTLVVAPGGRLTQNWQGAYADDMKGRIEQFFALQLPGLQEQDMQWNSPK